MPSHPQLMGHLTSFFSVGCVIVLSCKRMALKIQKGVEKDSHSVRAHMEILLPYEAKLKGKKKQRKKTSV